MQISFTVTNKNIDTIWGKLAIKLGREPTNDEVKEEVKRILDECLQELAAKGQLNHQK